MSADDWELDELLLWHMSPFAYSALTTLRGYATAGEIQTARAATEFQAARELDQKLGWPKDMLERAKAGKADMRARGVLNRQRAQMQSQAFIDLHLYFICWGRVEAMLKYLLKEAPWPELRGFYNPHKTTLDHYREARDHLEHFAERMPGGKKQTGDLGNLAGPYLYSFAGDTWDFSPGLLSSLVSQLDQVLRTAAKKRDDKAKP